MTLTQNGLKGAAMQTISEAKDKHGLKDRIKKLHIKSYIVYAGLSFIIGRSVLLGEVSPFIFGFLAFAILDANKKISPAFALLGALTTGDMSLCIRVAVYLTLMYGIKYSNIFNARNIYKASMASVCTLISSAVIILIMSPPPIDYIIYITEAVCAFCMYYVFNIGIGSVRTYIKKHTLGDEEIICISIISIVLVTACNGLIFYNYNIMVMFAIYAVLLSAYFEGIKASLPVSVLISLSLVLSENADISIMAVFAFGALLASVGVKINKVIAALAFILGMSAILIYIDGLSGILMYIKEAAAAGVLFMALPIIKKESAARESKNNDINDEAMKIYIKQQMDKQRAAQKVLFIRDEKRKITANDDRNKTILGNVVKDVCSLCYMYNNCWSVNAQNKIAMFSDIIKKFGNEKAIDKSEFLKSCKKPELMKNSVNYLVTNSMERKDRQRQLERQREYFLTKQQSLIELSEEIFSIMQNGVVKYGDEEKSISSALRRRNIDFESVFVFGDRRNIMRIFVSMPKSGISKQERGVISECVFNSIGVKVDFESEYKKEDGGICLFIEAPLLRLSVAQKKTAKKNSDYSGDSSTIADIDKGLVLAAIADGMGSGIDAQVYSGRLLDIIEDLLGSGIDIKTAVNMANGVMDADDEKDIFSTLDALLFDEYTADAVIMKAGACATYIKTEKCIEKIEFDTTPIGILDKPKIKIAYRNMEPNSYIYMFSDGFSSAVSDEQIIKIIETTYKRSPQLIVDGIFEEFEKITGNEDIDDITVMVAKVWERLS
jgi:stage II sporulation protein E